MTQDNENPSPLDEYRQRDDLLKKRGISFVPPEDELEEPSEEAQAHVGDLISESAEDAERSVDSEFEDEDEGEEEEELPEEEDLTEEELEAEEAEIEEGYAVESELPDGFDPEYGFEEDETPAGIRTLFPDENARRSTDLAKITETPARMIVPLVRAEIIVAAQDEKRTKPLLQMFVEKFDRRMISKDRKGRIEAVEMIKGLSAAEEDEDEALI